MSLRRYQQMRDFTRTAEPRGAPPKARGAGRFVIQKHAATRLHYDFRLELDGVLKSWAVPKGPSMNPKDRRLAVHVEDHPVEYGSFEGTIPAGEYGGGTVVLWDRGEWFPEGDVHAAYKKGHLRFRLAGEKLHGGFSLVRMHGRGGDKNWLLIKSEDDDVDLDGEVLVRERPESVATGRTLADIAADPKKRVWRSDRKQPAKARKSAAPKRPVKAAPRYGHAPKPALVEPELATLVDEVPTGDDWLHEIKYDGYRLLARIDRGEVQLLTRKHEDWSPRFPWLVDALRAQVPAEAALLDGELVHLGPDGVTRFGPLQQAISTGRHDGLVYYAFDLLHLQGVDVRRNPLHERKQALAELFKKIPTDGRLRLSGHIEGDGARLLGRACKLGLEGVICKKRDAPYRAGRHRDWLKVRCGKRQEIVVGGFTAARSGPRRLGALLVGVFDDAGNFTYSGKVGTGFDHAAASDLRDRLDELVTPRSPFATTPPGFARATFVRPELVADVQFTEWTADDRLRHPVFVGIREDKRAKDVRRERPVDREPPKEHPVRPATPRRPAAKKTAAKKTPAKQTPAKKRTTSVEVLGVPLTHPDRVLYPDDAITKHDLALYYESLSGWILPWISGRPLSVVRCPDGIAGAGGPAKQCFFQKHLPHELPPGLLTADLDEHEPYLYTKTAKGLAALAQVGALELHVWGSTVAHPDDPDRIVLDLDPGPGVPWARIKETAAAMRTRLADLDLESFLKTTGGKGLHVVVPLTRGRQTWDDVKSFARGIALEFARAAPTLFTATASKAGRSGKIYIDYLRNHRGATAIAPFSPRARPGAPVAVPLRWDELSALASPNKYTIKNVLRRLTALRADPWAELPRIRQSLRATLLRDVARAA